MGHFELSATYFLQNEQRIKKQYIKISSLTAFFWVKANSTSKNGKCPLNGPTQTPRV